MASRCRFQGSSGSARPAAVDGSSVTLPCRPPEKALRTKEQHEHEHDEHTELRALTWQQQRPELFGETDDQPADEGSDHVAHTAEHDDHECQDVEQRPRGRLDRDKRRDQGAGSTGTGGAERERQRVDTAHVDAHHLCTHVVGGHCADRRTQAGALQQQEEPSGENQGTHEREQVGQLGDGTQDLHTLVTRQRDRAGVGADEHQQRVLDHQSDAQRDQELVLQRLPHRAGQNAALDTEADQEHRGHGDTEGQVRVQAQRLHQPEREEQRNGQERTMREVDDVEDPEDQRQPHGQQPVDATDQDSGEHRLGDHGSAARPDEGQRHRPDHQRHSREHGQPRDRPAGTWCAGLRRVVR